MLPRQDNDKEERISIEEMSNVKDGRLLLGIRFNELILLTNTRIDINYYISISRDIDFIGR